MRRRCQRVAANRRPVARVVHGGWFHRPIDRLRGAVGRFSRAVGRRHRRWGRPLRFLQSEIPAIQKAGSTGGAVAQLAIDYADWIGADPSRGLPDAAAMDTLTEASCPDVRASVLRIIGGDNFANSF